MTSLPSEIPRATIARTDRVGASLRRQRLWLICLAAASGCAGLGYEIVWMRQFSLVLGTEMMAVLGSIAGFFAGLALGAFALDRLIRRASSARQVYALLEAVIGGWGVCAIWLLPAAGRALAPLLGTEPSPVLLWTGSFALPTMVLLPATVAMGGTLAALERMLRESSADAPVAAAVYGANTAGAVAGTLLSTFLLIPAVGLSATLLCLAAVNALCALGALTTGVGPHGVETDAGRAPQRGRMTDTRLAVTLFATGLLGIAFEILIVRLAAQVLQDTVYTYASLLAAYLLGTAAGGWIWQRVRRHGSETRLFALLAITALACLMTAFLVPHVMGAADSALQAGMLGELAIALALFLVPSIAMGALFAHLAQDVRDIRGSLGWAVGINSVGAAIAPMLAAQLLIPKLGAWTALIGIALGYLLLLPPRRVALLWAAAPVLAALILLAMPAPMLVKVPPGGRLLAVREGPMVTASAVEDAMGVRYLEVNGRSRMGGTSSVRSDYRQALLPLLLHPAPRRALFLGIGTGATIVGGARMPGTDIRGVELSHEVIDLLPWFANPDATQDTPPITVADARRYVVADSGSYDVIVADLFHPALDGSGALYTTEHFAAVRERLTQDGIFCQWLPLYQLDQPSLRAIIRSFLAVYPGASAWLNHYSVRTPMLALIGAREARPLDPDALAARLRDPQLRHITHGLGFDAPIDVLGQYLGGSNALAAFAGDGPRNTDDNPFVTYDARRNVEALSAPPWSLLLGVIRSMPTEARELLASAQHDLWSARLEAYWRARNRFIEAGAALTGDPRGPALIAAAAPGLLDALRLSAEFEPAYAPLMSMARSLRGSDRAAAQRLLSAIDAAAPSRAEARDLLAHEFAD
ncbi:spermidine synthase [Bradyrhizobium sp. STM 3557]|uniref:spermine/spermidine synthase domain-containing protein n=1 Tax=Bradyrhizobium sp. STM 3557 TaxID=578920 RepID=UPI00388E5F5B